MAQDLKGFIRIDGQSRIVAGSLILRKSKPKVGRWQEIPAYNRFITGEITCCNPPSPFDCVSYGVSVSRGDSVTFSYTSCDLTISGPHTIEGPVSDVFCAIPDTIAYEGTATFTLLGECEPTTTTTTTGTPTTTTTTTL